MTAPYLEQIPAELAFATPGDWFALRVPREPADADTLASQILAAQPRLTQKAVERMARGLVTACAELEVLCAYTTALDVPGGPLPATVLANVYPLSGLTVFQLAEQMSASDEHGVTALELERFSLPAGPTARIERLQEWDGEHSVVFLVVHYIAEIPGTGIAIMLTFATPAIGLAVELRRLFHQIACTLRFAPSEQR